MPENVLIDLLKTLQFMRKRRKFAEEAVGGGAYKEGYIFAYDECIQKVEDMLDSHATSAGKFAESVRQVLNEEESARSRQNRH